jgi:hypothetical protein
MISDSTTDTKNGFTSVTTNIFCSSEALKIHCGCRNCTVEHHGSAIQQGPHLHTNLASSPRRLPFPWLLFPPPIRLRQTGSSHVVAGEQRRDGMAQRWWGGGGGGGRGAWVTHDVGGWAWVGGRCSIGEGQVLGGGQWVALRGRRGPRAGETSVALGRIHIWGRSAGWDDCGCGEACSRAHPPSASVFPPCWWRRS